MGKKNKAKFKKTNVTQPATPLKLSGRKKTSLWPWLLLLAGVTAVCFWSMLKNKLTNWDDEFYVVQNALLRGPDWKGIFTKPVVSNYHPVTIITLAINYGLTGLDASSYLIFNLILHLINTTLVFYFIWTISDKKIWAAFVTALVFAIHPMHVESVAWVSERKDVLYTLFFLLAMLQYWNYLRSGKKINFWFCFLLFLLSILSKPAAIIFPLVLLALDYWKGRVISLKVLLEKIPFFVISLVFAIITVKIQSKTAIAGLDFFPLWTRFFFACYVVMIYFARFFIPYPLSAFHPYPSPDHLGLPIMLSPIFILALLAFVWYKRKNKLVVFTFAFFMINLLLVLQIISIGGTLVAERYTYVPYIGLAFLSGMWLNKFLTTAPKALAWLVPAVIAGAFGFISFQRTQVWKDSDTLWTDVINHYPDAPVPRTNRANYYLHLAADSAYSKQKNELIQKALEDCDHALKIKPNHAKGYENRQNIYLTLNRDTAAFNDATAFIKLEPNNRLGYYTRGVVYTHFNKPDSALADFNKCLSIDPDVDYALNNRGSLLFNHFKKYTEAVSDFTHAIQISPKGNYYLNRSYCYFMLGDSAKAKADAQAAVQKGVALPENYKNIIK